MSSLRTRQHAWRESCAVSEAAIQPSNPVKRGWIKPVEGMTRCKRNSLGSCLNFQGSPHDTRKLLAQAARNGHFFVLNRTNGHKIVSKPFVPLN